MRWGFQSRMASFPDSGAQRWSDAVSGASSPPPNLRSSGRFTEASSRSRVTVRTVTIRGSSSSEANPLSKNSSSCPERALRSAFRRFWPSARLRCRCFPGELVDPGRRAYIAVGTYATLSSRAEPDPSRFFVRHSFPSRSFQSSPSGRRSGDGCFDSSTTRSAASSRPRSSGSGPLQGLARLEPSSAACVSPCSSLHNAPTRADIHQSRARGFEASPSEKEDRINPLSSHDDAVGSGRSAVAATRSRCASRLSEVVVDRSTTVREPPVSLRPDRVREEKDRGAEKDRTAALGTSAAATATDSNSSNARERRPASAASKPRGLRNGARASIPLCSFSKRTRRKHRSTAFYLSSDAEGRHTTRSKKKTETQILRLFGTTCRDGETRIGV
mmetsp:Transcript_27809/g.65359  ORF Transcript_27809/g.65359 Transcript_27809/m.65359 type:complete len:387 (+) Transcript_27809:2258-3418(+)